MPVDPKEKEEALKWAKSLYTKLDIYAIGIGDANCADVLVQALREAEAELVKNEVNLDEGRCIIEKLEKELSKSREDCARKDEALSRVLTHAKRANDPEAWADTLHMVSDALSPDQSWLERHDAEKDSEMAALKRSIGSGGIVAMEMPDRIRELEDRLAKAEEKYAELRGDMDGTVYALGAVWDRIEKIDGPAWDLVWSSLMHWNDYLDDILYFDEKGLPKKSAGKEG